MPGIWILLLKVMKALDLLVPNLFRFWQGCELRLRLKEDHGRHIRAVDRIDEVSVPIQSITDKLKRRQLIRKRRVQRLQLIPLAGSGLGIIEIVHDLDDVGAVSAMEFEMVL